VNKRYVTADESAALADQVQGLPFGSDIKKLLAEFNAAETLEARIAKDADQIDLILELKGELDTGNPRAEEWLFFAQQRLMTESGKRMAQEILSTDGDSWWFDKETDWWINGPETH
jgi:putative hydrolase of HD superfamily